MLPVKYFQKLSSNLSLNPSSVLALRLTLQNSSVSFVSKYATSRKHGLYNSYTESRFLITFQENQEGVADNSQTHLTTTHSDPKHRFTHANKGQLSKSFVSTHVSTFYITISTS